jgi:ferredoxin
VDSKRRRETIPYKNATIYFMTGTGNSFRTATWIAEAVRRQGTEARVIPYERARVEEEVEAGPGELLGIVMPTHGFTSPWPILRFALGLPRGRGTHAFVTPTRGSVRIGRALLPGSECTAGYLVALLLWLRGYAVRGVRGIDMPLNWMSLIPGLHPKSVEAIRTQARGQVSAFMDSILSGSRCFRWGSFAHLLFGLLLLPISVLYLLFGRFFLSKLFFANFDCNGCGLCVENCPNGALRMWGNDPGRPYWTYSCESCMRCMGYCPEKAVEAGHSVGVILYYVTAVPVSTYVLNLLDDSIPWLADLKGTWAETILQYPYFLLSMFLAYWLLTHLIRIPLINRAFTYTTLTHLYRRYHEPDTALRDIKVRKDTSR